MVESGCRDDQVDLARCERELAGVGDKQRPTRPRSAVTDLSASLGVSVEAERELLPEVESEEDLVGAVGFFEQVGFEDNPGRPVTRSLTDQAKVGAPLLLSRQRVKVPRPRFLVGRGQGSKIPGPRQRRVSEPPASGAAKKCRGSQFRQDGLGMPSPYVVENKRSSVGARHASPLFRRCLGIFSQPLSRRSSS